MNAPYNLESKLERNFKAECLVTFKILSRVEAVGRGLGVGQSEPCPAHPAATGSHSILVDCGFLLCETQELGLSDLSRSLQVLTKSCLQLMKCLYPARGSLKKCP